MKTSKNKKQAVITPNDLLDTKAITKFLKTSHADISAINELLKEILKMKVLISKL